MLLHILNHIIIGPLKLPRLVLKFHKRICFHGTAYVDIKFQVPSVRRNNRFFRPRSAARRPIPLRRRPRTATTVRRRTYGADTGGNCVAKSRCPTASFICPDTYVPDCNRTPQIKDDGAAWPAITGSCISINNISHTAATGTICTVRDNCHWSLTMDDPY